MNKMLKSERRALAAWYAYRAAKVARERLRACTMMHNFTRRIRLRRVQIYVYAGMIKIRVPSQQPAHLVGARRSEIVGFSLASRKRMLEGVMSWRNLKDAYFVHLTYHDFPNDWHEWKRHLKNFLARLKRRFPSVGVMWKLELQRRGAPHYHMIVSSSGVRLLRFRQWVAAAWSAIAHQQSQFQGKYATRVDTIFSRAHALSYASKYCAKLSEMSVDDDGVLCPPPQMGRIWGFFGAVDRSEVLHQTTSRGGLRDLRAAALSLLYAKKSSYVSAFDDLLSFQGFSLFYVGSDNDDRVLSWREFASAAYVIGSGGCVEWKSYKNSDKCH